MHIFIKNGHEWRQIAVKKCSSLNQALKEYYKDALEPKGYTDPDYKGNLLTTTSKHGRDDVYIALEITQQPVDDRH